ncbi:cation transporter [Anaeromyxobacter oryzae]|uniref:Sodium:proton antiporter n=1 Tax=Anaeromyxobacter oryzae TaxID=2918170 RepID=A0ABM7X1M9_9BACT|nr:cation transporter [Anaeromyxobacter oryzae]BDG05694.1 sodium:proton antiporter [Anaeromyxobacter oryzae]
MVAPGPMKSVFAVPRMDCPSEERMIRMALDGVVGISDLRFDLGARTVTVAHAGDPAPLLAKLESLGLGARLSRTEKADPVDLAVPVDDATEARTLRVLLAINAAMFIVELVAGWLAQSSGLIADSLDMLADATVYGLSLWAVGKAAAAKVRAAHVSGMFQGVLAVGVLADVFRRVVAGSAPEAPAMVGISLIALAANVSCLVLISRHRHGGAHMRASWIFSTNDVLANFGVIVAGALVAWTGSRIPDLVVGAAVGLLVLAGAVRILRLR